MREESKTQRMQDILMRNNGGFEDECSGKYTLTKRGKSKRSKKDSDIMTNVQKTESSMLSMI